MKYTGNYTKDTAKAIKAAEKLICTTTEDGAIYLCSGYWMYKMNPLEYATVAQPVTHCDAGNWTIDNNGKHDGNNGTNLLKIFEEAAKAAEHKPALERCPLSLNRDNLTAYLYHSPDGFAAAYNGLYISAISKGHEFIRAHLAESLTVERLCRELHVSRTNLYAALQPHLESGIAAYIRRVRLEEAMRLVQGTALPIDTVAARVGFDDYNYFLRVFKKTYGASPRKWR